MYAHRCVTQPSYSPSASHLLNISPSTQIVFPRNSQVLKRTIFLCQLDSLLALREIAARDHEFPTSHFQGSFHNMLQIILMRLSSMVYPSEYGVAEINPDLRNRKLQRVLLGGGLPSRGPTSAYLSDLAAPSSAAFSPAVNGSTLVAGVAVPEALALVDVDAILKCLCMFTGLGLVVGQ